MSANPANPLDMEGLEPTKPDLVVFFVIDRSGSMGPPMSTRINSVNTAMRETIPILKGVGGSDANLKIAVLTFSNGAQWMYTTPIDVGDFEWTELNVEGYTDFGAACNELCKKMSRSAFMASKVGYKKPVVILITDGEPTDDGVWQKALKELKENKWFRLAIKIALAVDEADEGVLVNFVGTREGVFRIEDTDKLKRLIKIVTVTSSELARMSTPIDINVSDTAGETLDDVAEKETYQAIHAAIVEDEEDWD
jgi:uncharacterized protein YegL